jgi:diacylglycerol kinase family enzyme
VPGRALIVNPFASGVTERRLESVARALGDPEVHVTHERGHAVELARELSGRVAALYVFSGDGGFNEVLNGVDATTPVGFVPGGGTSVLARALGLPGDPLRAAEQLASATTRRIALGRVNGRRFGFSAGVGLDAELVRRIEARGRTREGRRSGDVAFAWTTLRAVAERRARFEPVLEVEGHGRAAFALVANCGVYTYAGPVPLRLAPEAAFELGLDLVAPRSVDARRLVPLALALLRGRARWRGDDVLYVHDADGFRITCDVPLPLQADGEDLGDVDEAVFAAEHDAVTVLV